MESVCLIVGASGDIGGSVAKRLAEEGYSLLLHYNENENSVIRLKQSLPERAIVGFVKGDLSNSAGIQSFLEKINFPIEHIIFTSGKSAYGLFVDTNESTMDEMLHLHVKTPWMITNQLLPYMIANRRGNIIVISSIWGEVGASCEVVYSSVKGAQNSFVKALAKEVAPSGISVNGISPGFIDTKMNANFSDEDKKNIINEIPLNRAGNPDEVAHVVSFLLDSRSAYIQGEIINVTGAW